MVRIRVYPLFPVVLSVGEPSHLVNHLQNLQRSIPFSRKKTISLLSFFYRTPIFSSLTRVLPVSPSLSQHPNRRHRVRAWPPRSQPAAWRPSAPAATALGSGWIFLCLMGGFWVHSGVYKVRIKWVGLHSARGSRLFLELLPPFGWLSF